jgi:diguanylate cyclase (GGDEF)-like protein
MTTPLMSPKPRDVNALRNVVRWGGGALGLLAVLALVQFVVAVATGAERMVALSIVSLLVAGAGAAFAFIAVPPLLERLTPQQEAGEFDSVTGVRNLAYVQERLGELEQHARETLRPAIVLYIDLENLPRVNKDFGYTVGDIVLKTVAQLIARSARNGDTVGRVVGDEFVIVMPDSTIADAEVVAEAIRQEVDEFHMDLRRRGAIDYLSCKIGTAVFPTDGASPNAVIAAARAAMS